MICPSEVCNSTKPTTLKNIFKFMRFLNGVEGSSYSVRKFQKMGLEKRESWSNLDMDITWTDTDAMSMGVDLCPTSRPPLKNIFKFMRFLNGVEGSSYSVRIFQKMGLEKRERVVNSSIDLA